MADTMSLNLTLHSDIGTLHDEISSDIVTLHDEINDMKTETEQTRPPIGNNKKK